MALRKCPGCKNLIAAETESCPICGCEPRARRLKQIVIALAALIGTAAAFHSQLRQHLPHVHSPPPAQAQTGLAVP
jgi:hypothetical protein